MEHKIRVYFQPAFLICIAILAGGEITKSILGIVIPDKEPLPLKKTLELLDEENLKPYEVIMKFKIENEQIVKELGTEDYIQWTLKDTEPLIDSTAQELMLFITYYKLPDVVPHVPEECYTGGGYEKIESESITFEINNNAGFMKSIRGKYLVFGSKNSNLWQGKGKFPVLYFFRVNGKYVGSREEARITLNKNIFGKFSYFSKVELVFNQGDIVPDKEGAFKASQKLLGVILPILEAEYWPEWQKEESGGE